MMMIITHGTSMMDAAPGLPHAPHPQERILQYAELLNNLSREYPRCLPLDMDAIGEDGRWANLLPLLARILRDILLHNDQVELEARPLKRAFEADAIK